MKNSKLAISVSASNVLTIGTNPPVTIPIPSGTGYSLLKDGDNLTVKTEVYNMTITLNPSIDQLVQAPSKNLKPTIGMKGRSRYMYYISLVNIEDKTKQKHYEPKSCTFVDVKDLALSPKPVLSYTKKMELKLVELELQGWKRIINKKLR